MCVITSIVSGITAAVMGTLSAVGSAAATAATAVTGIGTVAAGTGIAGSSIGFTGAGLTGILTAGAGPAAGAGSMAGLGSALASTATGLGSALGGLATETLAAVTTDAFGAGAASFAESMSALGAESIAAGATSTANAVGVETAAQTALAESVLGGTMVNGELIAATTPATQAATTAATTSGSAISSEAIAAGKTLLTEASMAANAVGTGIEAFGAYQQGVQTAAALSAMAAAERDKARQTQEAAETEARDLARKQKMARGAAKVAASANGIMLEGRAESSPNIFEQDQMAEEAWDRQKLFYNANQRMSAYYNNANQYLIQARNARRTSNLRAVTSLIRGGAGMALGSFA